LNNPLADEILFYWVITLLYWVTTLLNWMITSDFRRQNGGACSRFSLRGHSLQEERESCRNLFLAKMVMKGIFRELLRGLEL